MRAPLPHPFVRLSARARRAGLLVLAPVAFLMMFVLSSLDASLRTPASRYGIVSFEFAGDRESAGRMLEAWGSPGRRAAARSLRLDFVYLAAYAPGLALLCAAAADRARAAGSRLATPGAALAWGQLAAGGLDAVENLALLRVLGGSPEDAWPALAAACAWPKFALVAAGLLYLAASAVSRLTEAAARLDHPRVVGRLLAALRRPALGGALLLGLAIAGVLAIPWYGGSPEGPPQISRISRQEVRAPAPAPEPRAETTETREAARPQPPVAIATLVPAEAPVYRPDPELAGGSLASERSAPVIRAGVASGLPEIRALGPEHVGATAIAAPTLYWFLSEASSVPVRITLTSEAVAAPLLDLRVEPPVGAGLHALRLERRGVRLDPGVTHRWFVALVPDPENRATDLVASAAVRRVAAADALTGQLAAAAPAEHAHVLAAAGYWYDAFDTLTRWIQIEPAAERLREHRAALLEQVGLAGVGGLLSAPVAPPKPAGDASGGRPMARAASGALNASGRRDP